MLAGQLREQGGPDDREWDKWLVARTIVGHLVVLARDRDMGVASAALLAAVTTELPTHESAAAWGRLSAAAGPTLEQLLKQCGHDDASAAVPQPAVVVPLLRRARDNLYALGGGVALFRGTVVRLGRGNS